MRLLYPCSLDDRKQPDELFAQEYAKAREGGIQSSLFSLEDFELDSFRARPKFDAGEQVIYRGWMMNPDRYADLCAAIAFANGVPITTAEQYRQCHHLPQWFEACKDLTPDTVFCHQHDDFDAILNRKGWSRCFVKDYVKSLTTHRGSIANSADEVIEVIQLIEKYRGAIEGGICLRQYEPFEPETEERYFVFGGKAYARDGIVPDIVNRVAERIDSPFYSVDIAAHRDGTLRLIEIGDGQVSDIKAWHADDFIKIFN